MRKNRKEALHEPFEIPQGLGARWQSLPGAATPLSNDAGLLNRPATACESGVTATALHDASAESAVYGPMHVRSLEVEAPH
jgi:hypothetical protein